MPRKLFELIGELGLKGVKLVETNLTAVDKKAKKVSKAFTKMGRKATNLGASFTKNVTGPLLAVGGSLLFAAEKTGQYADSILDLQAITGLSTDSLQEFENVARTAGVDFKKLTNTISIFSSKLPMIAKGTGTAYEAIEKLGVNLFDVNGEIRDMDNLFPDLINSLQSIENVTERNSIAQQIFGAKLTALGPVLGLTAEELKESREEAHELGLVLSGEALDAANEYRIESGKLRAEFTAFWRNISIKVIPVLKDKLIPFIRGTLQPAFEKTIEVIIKLVDWFDNLSSKGKKIVAAVGAAVVAMGPFLLILGQIITSMKVLAPAIALVNLALLANPFALAAVGIVALTVAIGGAVKAYKDVQKEHQKWSVMTAEDAQINQLISLVDTLTQSIIKYGDELKDPIKAQELLGDEMKEAVKAARALGFVVEGTLIEKMERLNQVSNGLKGTVFDLKTGLVKVKKEQEDYTEVNEKAIKTTKGLTEAEIKRMEQIRKRQEKFTRSQQTEWKDNQKAKEDQLKKILEEQKNFYDSIEQMAFESQASKLGILNKEEHDALMNADKILAGTEELEKAKLLITEEYAAKRKEVEAELQRSLNNIHRAGNALEKFFSDERVQMAIDVIGKILSLSIQFTENKIALLDKEFEKNKSVIEKSTLSEKEKAERITNLEKKKDKEKLKLQKESAKRNKALAIFEALVNTALAITGGLKVGGFVGIALAILYGILGGIQVAAIASEPMPFEEGALIKGNRGGVQGLIGEGTGDEIIFPLETGVMQLADALINKLSEVSGVRSPGAGLASAIAGGNVTKVYENNWHIGTLIADDEGIKELERRQLPFRVAEEQRKGERS